jgi:iron uptake system EfeUOB component EfeO/EfeM
MARPSYLIRALVAFAVAAGAIAVIAVIATRGGTSAAHASTVALQQPPGLATYSEGAPHVTSQLNVYGLQGSVRGSPATPPSELNPLSPGALNAPIAAYRVFAGHQLRLMEGQITRLGSALSSDDRAGAQAAWRGAFVHYLELGAVYLQGQIADLNQAIDGNAGGLPGGTASPQFSGLHRLELDLWTGAPLPSLVPWAQRLGVDVRKLRSVLPQVQIAPLDYATRAHEILEDAARDLLSGTDVPWSGEGVLGTAAGITATQEVIATLRPVLANRETVLAVVDVQLRGLQAAMMSIRAAHGGRLPTNSELSQHQSELLANAMGAALEALAQVPGALETTSTPTIPQIPPRAVRIDP